MDHQSASDLVARVMFQYEREGFVPPEGLAVEQVFAYIHFKAYTFLQFGPETHRQLDALQMPPATWSDDKLAVVRNGCEQIVRFRGLSIDSPLESLGVGGFSALVQLFHFVPIHQTAFVDGPGHVVDAMRVKHIVDQREALLFNRVKLRGLRKDPGPPCPYCGEPLRTPKAKQCRACGMDWHDPEHAFCRKPASES